MQNSKYIWLLSLLIYFVLFNNLKCKLRFAFVMFRHGARGPLYFLNETTDVAGEKWHSSGELTEIGMRQHYLLGVRNKERYANFISNSYDPKEIYVISTNVNRTIMSAYSQLQGLFSPGTGPAIADSQIPIAIPPGNDTDFSQEQQKLGNNALPNKIQVVPIHLFEPNSKNIQLIEEYVCPPVKEIKASNKQKQIVTDFNLYFNQTYGERLMTAFNIKNNAHFLDYDNIHNICDTYVSDYTEGRDLSIFKNSGIDLSEFNRTAFQQLEIDIDHVIAGDPIVGLMGMSPPAQDILKWMDGRIKNDIDGIGYLTFSSPKFVMYSAHDTYLGAFQSFLKTVFNKTEIIYPSFASSLYFELFTYDKNIEASKITYNDYYVQISFNNILLLNLTFTDFRDGINKNSYSASQIAEFCKFPNPTSDTPFNFFILTTIILGVCAIILGIVLIYQRKMQSKRDNSLL